MPVVLYADATAVVARAGEAGVTLRTDDDPNTIDDVLEAAAVDVDFWLGPVYSQTALAGSEWVARACRDIAVRYLCLRRLNAVPKSVELRYQEVLELLKLLASGARQLPDAAARKANAPVLSNQRTHLSPHPRVTTERPASTGVPAGYPPRDDPTGILDYVV